MTIQAIHSGSITLPTTAGTTYQCLMGGHSMSFNATEANRKQLSPASGTFQNLRVTVGAAPGTGKSWAFTVRVNGSDTAVTLTIADSATSASDLVHTGSVTAGQTVSISCVTTSTPSSTSCSIGLEFVPTTAGETMLLGVGSHSDSANTQYCALSGYLDASATEDLNFLIVPCAGTVKSLYAVQSATLGTGKTRTLTVRKTSGGSTSDTTLTCQLNAASAANDTAHSFTVAAGDILTVSTVPSGTPSNRTISIGVVFLPDTSGQFLVGMTPGGASALNTATTSYLPVAGTENVNSTEPTLNSQVSAYTISAMYAWLTAAPGSGKTRTFALRRNNTTTTALSVAIADTATSGNASASVALTAGDLIDTSTVVSGGTPSAAYAAISYLATFSTPAVLAAETGTFALTGIDASLTVVGILAAQTGSFSLTGNDVTLTYTVPPTYYVKNGGNDSLDGLSDGNAWETIGKVNGHAFDAGSRVLFARGSTWSTRLQPTAAGTSGSPIVFGSYGTGAPPRITGTTRGLQVDTDYLHFQAMDFDGLYVSSTAQGAKFLYCLIHNGTTHGISVDATGEATAYNCTITGCTGYGFYVTGTLTARNCIVVGNGKTYRSLYASAKANSGGVLDYDYCLIDGTTGTGTLTDGGHNQINVVPKFVACQANDCYFNFSTDDTSISDSYKADLIAALNSTTKITMYVNSSTPGASGAYALFAAASAAGHEIANHTRHHIPLDATYMATLTTTNSAPTVNVDIAGKQIVLATTTPGNSVTVSWASTPKLYTDLKTAVVGKGWTFTGTYGMDGRDMDIASLEDTGGAQAVTSYQLMLNLQRYYDAEIKGNSDDIQAITGIWPDTLSYPYGRYRTSAYDYLAANGYLGARQQGETSIMYLTSPYNVYAADIESMSPVGVEAEVRARARWLYNFARAWGLAGMWYSHSAADASIAQVVWFTDEIEKCGGQWVTAHDMFTRIRQTHTTVDGQTYTKTYGDSGDYRLSVGSPAINAGTNVGLATDILGTTITGNPDIGAYEGAASNRLRFLITSASE